MTSYRDKDIYSKQALGIAELTLVGSDKNQYVLGTSHDASILLGSYVGQEHNDYVVQEPAYINHKETNKALDETYGIKRTIFNATDKEESVNKTLLFPILANSHWHLLAVDIIDSAVDYVTLYDSLSSGVGANTLWFQKLISSLKEQTPDLGFEYKYTGKQTDGSSCLDHVTQEVMQRMGEKNSITAARGSTQLRQAVIGTIKQKMQSEKPVTFSKVEEIKREDFTKVSRKQGHEYLKQKAQSGNTEDRKQQVDFDEIFARKVFMLQDMENFKNNDKALEKTAFNLAKQEFGKAKP